MRVLEFVAVPLKHTPAREVSRGLRLFADGVFEADEFNDIRPLSPERQVYTFWSSVYRRSAYRDKGRQ